MTEAKDRSLLAVLWLLLPLSVIGSLLHRTDAFELLGALFLAVTVFVGMTRLLVQVVILKSIPKSIVKPLLMSISFVLIYAIRWMYGDLDVKGLTMTLQLAAVLSFLWGGAFFCWDRARTRVFFIVVVMFFVANAVLWLNARSLTMFRGLLTHSNSLGGYLFALIFFPVLMVFTERQTWKWLGVMSTMVGLTLLAATTARAVWLAVLVCCVTLLAWPFICRHRLLFRGWLIVLFLGLFVTAQQYVALARYDYARDLNRFVRELTFGKQLFSGREAMWLVLGQAIWERPLFGHGPGVSIADLSGIFGLSAHNFYMQTAVQVGLFGLTVFLFLVLSIWDVYWYGRMNQGVRVAGAFTTGFLAHQMFEVSLTQNNVVLGVLAWLVIGVGISKSMWEARLESIRTQRGSSLWQEYVGCEGSTHIVLQSIGRREGNRES
jgi:O-antigen ligase